MNTPYTTEQIDARFRDGLNRIKRQITSEETELNIELHQAIQELVEAARMAGYLKPLW